jgi:hypothetical protein
MLSRVFLPEQQVTRDKRFFTGMFGQSLDVRWLEVRKDRM